METVCDSSELNATLTRLARERRTVLHVWPQLDGTYRIVASEPQPVETR